MGYFAYAQYDVLFYLSLRGSIATAAIPLSKVRGKCCVLFRGDRHACARDDTEIQLSLRAVGAANSREGGFPQGISIITLVVGYFACAQYDVLFLHVILNDSEESHRKSTRHILRPLFQRIATALRASQ